MSLMLSMTDPVTEKHAFFNFLKKPWSIAMKPWIMQNHLIYILKEILESLW